MSRVLAVLLVLGVCSAEANEPLWALPKGGGQVVLIRQTITTPGVGDPPGFRLDHCATQRNLTDEGRGHAKRIGEAFRARAIPPDTGEMVIVTPQGGGRFAVAGRLGVN